MATASLENVNIPLLDSSWDKDAESAIRPYMFVFIFLMMLQAVGSILCLLLTDDIWSAVSGLFVVVVGILIAARKANVAWILFYGFLCIIDGILDVFGIIHLLHRRGEPMPPFASNVREYAVIITKPVLALFGGILSYVIYFVYHQKIQEDYYGVEGSYSFADSSLYSPTAVCSRDKPQVAEGNEFRITSIPSPEEEKIIQRRREIKEWRLRNKSKKRAEDTMNSMEYTPRSGSSPKSFLVDYISDGDKTITINGENSMEPSTLGFSKQASLEATGNNENEGRGRNTRVRSPGVPSRNPSSVRFDISKQPSQENGSPKTPRSKKKNEALKSIMKKGTNL